MCKKQGKIKKDKNKIIGGMYEEGTHQVIDFNNCHIQDKVINVPKNDIDDAFLELFYNDIVLINFFN